MIGIDTNVLVRFITEDDPVQTAQADDLMRRCSVRNPGWVSVIVLCELVWVLGRGYSFSREEIAQVVSRLLRSTELEIEDAPWVRKALDYFVTSGCDFADALIGFRNSRSGAAPTYTFDKAAARAF